jgi:hypothetical protein
MQDVRVKLNSEFPWQNSAFNNKEFFFHQKTGLKLKEETNEVLHFEHSFVWC